MQNATENCTEEEKQLKLMNEKIEAELRMELEPTKMRRLLREFGVFPTVHRQIIWHYLLKLPQNTTNFRKMIYDAPLSKLPKPWAKWLNDNKSISKTIHTYMIRMLRWLAAWSPEVGKVTFLPQFILPFVRALRTDPMTCFELITTVILNWGYFWLEMSPMPPFDLMCMIEQLLQRYGPGALKILTEHEVNVTQYAWPLLEHGFSKVLGAEQWTQMWDHLLCNTPAFTFAAIIAYVAITENALRTWVTSAKDAKEFYHEIHTIDMRQFLRKIYDIFDLVTNWPEQLLQPLTSLPQDSYPPLEELRKMSALPHKSEAAQKSQKKLVFCKETKTWDSFESRENWLQQKEAAMKKRDVFSIPAKKQDTQDAPPI